MAYRSSEHKPTGFTPNYTMFGREFRLPVDVMFGGSSAAFRSVSQYVQESGRTMGKAFDIVRDNTEGKQRYEKLWYDRRVKGPTYQVGDHVLLHRPAVGKGRSKKLHSPWAGPYVVKKALSDGVYRVQYMGGQEGKIVHYNNLKRVPDGTGGMEANDNPETGPDQAGRQVPHLQYMNSDTDVAGHSVEEAPGSEALSEYGGQGQFDDGDTAVRDGVSTDAEDEEPERGGEHEATQKTKLQTTATQGESPARTRSGRSVVMPSWHW